MSNPRRADPSPPVAELSPDAKVGRLVLDAGIGSVDAVRAQAAAILDRIDLLRHQNPTDSGRGWQWARQFREYLHEHDAIVRRLRYMESLAADVSDTTYPDPRESADINAELCESFGRAGGLDAITMATDCARHQIRVDSETLECVRGRINWAVAHLAGIREATGPAGLPLPRGSLEATLSDDLRRVELIESRASGLNRAAEQLPHALGESIESVISANGGVDVIALSLSLADPEIESVDPETALIRNDIEKLKAQAERMELMHKSHFSGADIRQIQEFRRAFIAPVEDKLLAKQREAQDTSAAVAASAREIVRLATKGDMAAIRQIHRAANRSQPLFVQGFAFAVIDGCARALACAGCGAFADGLAPFLVTAVDPLPPQPDHRD